MTAIKPEYGVNLNPEGPIAPKDKAIFALALLAFLAAMLVFIGWLISFHLAGVVLTVVFLVAAASVVVIIGWAVRKLVGLVRR